MNRPDFVVCMWLATCRWETFNEGYNSISDLILIRGLHEKLWGPKVTRVPMLVIKSHLDVGLVGSHKVYYKGEGGAFPQVWAVVNLVSPSCLWLVLTLKMLQLCTNHLVLTLCKPV
jgi:hypothetical protein